MSGRPLRVVAVADSDSYLKWAAGLLDALPAGWDCRLVVVRSPIAPSPAQRKAAVSGLRHGGQVAVRSLPRLLWQICRRPPDVVLLACTGPVVQVLADLLCRLGRRRPVLVSGLPGLCLPASARAVRFRSMVDVLVSHSRRERRGFAALAQQTAPGLRVTLARLPFLDLPPSTRPDVGRLVFAAQAKVPAAAHERRAVLLALNRLARHRPQLRPTVKLRGLDGEPQTHREDLPYDGLWRDLVAAGQVEEGAVEFAVGPMSEHLVTAAGLATVSSTAALEAMAARVPVLVLDDFGVGAQALNTAFADSGVLGSLEDLAAGRLRQPDPQWLCENYFHDAEECDWVSTVESLAADRRAGGLPARPAELHRPGARRRRRNHWRLLVPGPLLPIARRAAQLEARARRTVRRTVRRTA